jgi:uncharacterized protein YgfB (UPF0149 family)
VRGPARGGLREAPGARERAAAGELQGQGERLRDLATAAQLGAQADDGVEESGAGLGSVQRLPV